MDTHELAWAAGFFDGEGHISSRPHKSSRYNARSHRLILHVAQVPREPLDRLQRALGGMGHMRLYTPPEWKRSQPIWSLTVGRWTDIQAAVAMLWPYLSGPKREQAKTALLAYHGASHEFRGGQLRTMCRRDLHAMGDYRSSGARRCRECHLARRRQWWHANKDRVNARLRLARAL
jgi:hypothetical protein